MIFYYAEGLGRRIAVDLGFGAFLEKIEQHFGQRVLKVLLVLIGIAVALVCSKLIWEIALGPIVTFAVSTVASGQWIQGLVKVFWTAMACAAGVGLASLISANLLSWRDYKKGQELLRRTDKLTARAQETINEAEKVVGRAEAAIADVVALSNETKRDNAEARATLEAAQAAVEAAKACFSPPNQKA